MFKKLASGLALASVIALGIAGCASGGGGKYTSPDQWVQESKQGIRLPLAAEANKWSEAKAFKSPKGASVDVKSKFVKHYGTTCVYDVEAKNTGTSKANETFAVGKPDALNIYDVNSGGMYLEPGQSKAWGLELRECSLHWGDSFDPNACASCGPTFYWGK